MVDHLQVGPYRIPLLPLYGGPTPETREGSPEEPIALLFSRAVAQDFDYDFAGAIRDGRPMSDVISYVDRPENDEDDRRLRAAWEQKTGETLPPGAVARVGMMGRADTLPVSWAALQKALADLDALRASWHPEPGPWLFTARAKSRFVAPEDYEVVKKLEAEAAAIDELDFEAEVGKEPETLIARRRAFLRSCLNAGIFAEEFGADREKWLDFWFASRLLALRKSAAELRSWGLDGRVCLDYVRHQLWPPGEDGRNWAESGLRLIGTPADGDQGAVVERVGGTGTMRAWWRRDTDQPMLLAVAKG